MKRAAPTLPGAGTIGLEPYFSSQRWTLLTVLTVLYGVGSFGLLAVSPLSPFLLHGFGLTRFEVGLLVPAVYVGGLLFCVPAGHLVDRFRLRATLTGGLALGGVTLLIAAASPTFTALLGLLLLAGTGWIVVNPALSRAILLLFPLQERGLAMGIKQMGQTAGGIVGAFVLPVAAHLWGWRAALGASGALVLLGVALGWRPLGLLPHPDPPSRQRTSASPGGSSKWLRCPAIWFFLGSGLGLGMGQSVLLSYLPLYATQSLGVSAVGAGGLLAVAQAGGASGRLVLGAASDKWLGGRRAPCLVFTAGVTAGSFVLFAFWASTPPALVSFAAFGAGVGALGWLGLYMVLAAELGGSEGAGLMSGVSLAFVLGGILLGGPLFGLLLERTDSYRVAWTTFALISLVIAVALLASGAAIHRESLGRSTHAEAADEPLDP